VSRRRCFVASLHATLRYATWRLGRSFGRRQRQTVRLKIRRSTWVAAAASEGRDTGWAGADGRDPHVALRWLLFVYSDRFVSRSVRPSPIQQSTPQHLHRSLALWTTSRLANFRIHSWPVHKSSIAVVVVVVLIVICERTQGHRPLCSVLKIMTLKILLIGHTKITLTWLRLLRLIQLSN